MKIFTCLKEVAGRETRFAVNSQGTWIQEADLTFETNECDEYALEEALKLIEKHGGEVTILTLGSTRSEKSIRKGLAMGAQNAILINDPDRKASSPQVAASALACALEKEPFDLILAGTQSDDLGYAQTGVMLAEKLGLPHATIVMEIEVDPQNRRIKALREMEAGFFQWVELPMPALLTIQAGISQIRYASLKGIMQAKKKEIRRLDIGELGMEWPETPDLEVLKLYFPEPLSKAELLEGDVETMVSSLVEKLRKEAKVL